MASAPSDPKSVTGRVDRDGRLVSADPELEQLQLEAGSSLGQALVLPQLAGVARVARRLRIPVSRHVLAAAKDRDIDMWVRAVPEGDEVVLTIERWSTRPARPPRLSAIAPAEEEQPAEEILGWAVDEQLRVVSLSAPLAELLSIDGEAAGGKPLMRLFRLEESGEGELPLVAALASRSSFSGQRVKERQTGRELLLSGDPALGPGGSFAGFEGFAEVADGAQAAADPQPVVDSAVHSTLRSPLDAIVRSAEEMMERGGSARNDYAVYAADIAAAARHLLSVLETLGGEPAAAERDQVDLPELASEAVALIETAAREREIVIAIEPIEALSAQGDARSVIQILVNLIGNAVRYSAEGTAVTISFGNADGTALVHVADEGPGIDPADHERIFQPFQQGTDGKDGSGLGLSIARRLARSMGGDIELESSPGNGSLFTLVLPAA